MMGESLHVPGSVGVSELRSAEPMRHHRGCVATPGTCQALPPACIADSTTSVVTRTVRRPNPPDPNPGRTDAALPGTPAHRVPPDRLADLTLDHPSSTAREVSSSAGEVSSSASYDNSSAADDNSSAGVASRSAGRGPDWGDEVSSSGVTLSPKEDTLTPAAGLPWRPAHPAVPTRAAASSTAARPASTGRTAPRSGDAATPTSDPATSSADAAARGADFPRRTERWAGRA